MDTNAKRQWARYIVELSEGDPISEADALAVVTAICAGEAPPVEGAAKKGLFIRALEDY